MQAVNGAYVASMTESDASVLSFTQLGSTFTDVRLANLPDHSDLSATVLSNTILTVRETFDGGTFAINLGATSFQPFVAPLAVDAPGDLVVACAYEFQPPSLLPDAAGATNFHDFSVLVAVLEPGLAGVEGYSSANVGAFPGPDPPALAVAVDTNANIYVAGQFNSGLGPSPWRPSNAGFSNGLYLAHFNPVGALVSVQYFGPAEVSYLAMRWGPLAPGSPGALYLAGGFNGTLDFGPYGKLTSTSDAGIGTSDVFVAKLPPP